jgi:DNA replicative helicase MCM subunit Mcm2 (Cdc46/Mcm family)
MNQEYIIKAFDDLIKFYILPKEIKPLILKEIKDYFELYYLELREKRKSLILNINKSEKQSEKLFNLVMN